MARAPAWLQHRLHAARITQLRLLAAHTTEGFTMPICLSELDRAVQAHMAHPAMGGADPLTDSLMGQLEAPATEGGTPRAPAAAPLTAEQRLALSEASSIGEWVQWLLLGTVLAAPITYGILLAVQAAQHWWAAQ